MSRARRQLLLGLLDAGIRRVDGRRCTAAALLARPAARAASLVWAIAVGKAAGAMALGAADAFGSSLQRVLVVTKQAHAPAALARLRGAEVLESAHPVPDRRSLEAGARVLQWVGELPADVYPVFLVSGGASSLVEVLSDGVTLADLERLNAEGLAGGLDIAALNARRARLSRIKGGRLAAALGGRPACALFLSDVPGDDPAVIGSGLLGPAQGGAADAIERSVVARLEDAVQAVCDTGRALGLTVEAGAGRFGGEATRLAVRFAHELQLGEPALRVWGGESVMRLPPLPGRGGRSQHLALAAARLIAGQPSLVMLAAGTDGTDGPTDDAGALVDGDTCGRISLAGHDVDDCLSRADSGTALEAAGDLVHTGPTGTNVGDLVIGLKLPEETARGLPRLPPATDPARVV